MSRRLIFILVLSTLLGCSRFVPSEKVPGTYVASYPFGAETLTLNHDGSFTQRVEIKGESPLTASGTWSFDAKESRITLRGLLIVVDGFGHLNSDWRKSSPGIASLSVERLWFKINIGSGGEYPYIKQ